MDVEDESWRRATDVVCDAFAAAAPVDGAAFTQIRSAQETDTWCSSDEVVADLQRIQYALGEGPTWDAFRTGRPVLVPDVGTAEVTARWPMFIDQIAAHPVGGIFAIPMQVGAITAGVCLSYRGTPGSLSAAELRELLRAVDSATLALLALRARITTQGDLGEPRDVRDRNGMDGTLPRSVHQATGMLVVQLGVDVEDAFARLRAHAYATGQPLHAVAEDIVERRLRLEVDPPDPAPRRAP